MDSAPYIRFDGWVLDTRSGDLSRKGQKLRLQPQPLQVLEELLAHPGDVVTREQLIARLWPKGIVDFDTALNSAVRRLRQTLGDDAESPRYIETIARRGYRFVGNFERPDELPSLPRGPLQPAQDESQATSQPLPPPGPVETVPSDQRTATLRGTRTRWRTLALLLTCVSLAAALWTWQSMPTRASRATTPVTGQPSIAVLPFVDMSPARDQRYFADGLAEEVINLLAQTPGLRVTARTSSFAFRDQAVDIPRIAARLGVTHVLEGSVRRSGDKLRITAQLIDCSSNLPLWSRTYDRGPDDIFAVQTDIASSVTTSLRLVLQDHTGPAASPEAYDRYLLARYFFGRRSPGDVDRARTYFNQALQLDPRFPLAWAGLASVAWVDTAEGRLPQSEGLEQVRQAAEQALSFDPHIAEAHLRLALYLDRTGQPDAARNHVHVAVTIEPNNPLALGLMSGTAVAEHRTNDAIDLLRRAVVADPLSWVSRYNLADMLFKSGHLAEAREQALALQAMQPENPATLGLLCFITVVEGKPEMANEILRRWTPGSPDRLECLALVGNGAGGPREADKALAQLAASGASSDALRVAEVHAWRGQADEAFDWLRTAAVRSRGESGFGLYTRRLPNGDPPPLLAALRSDPRWAEWTKSSGVH